MAKTVEEMNIYERLAAIRELCEVIQKNKKGFNYKYVTEDEILSKITAGLKKYNISFFPKIKPGTNNISPYTYEKTKVLNNGQVITEKNNEIIVSAETEYTWICNDNPDSRIVIPWVLVGQQADASQAFGSGLTYSQRYFLLKFFNIATTDDDPDNWRSKQADVEKESELKAVKSIADAVDTYVKAFIEAKPDKKKEITDYLKEKIVVNGKHTANYYSVKDPVIIAGILQTIQQDFKIEEDEKEKK